MFVTCEHVEIGVKVRKTGKSAVAVRGGSIGWFYLAVALRGGFSTRCELPAAARGGFPTRF